MYDIIVVGGGPAGMMAAISAKLHHPYLKVSLLEKHEVLGLKLSYTGGGRCNVTSNIPNDEILKNIPRNPKFLYSALKNFGPVEIINFFEENGCSLKEENNHKMFPITNKSESIINTLQRKINELGIDIYFSIDVLKIENKTIYSKSKNFEFDKVIIATGGITFKKSLPNKHGYNIASKIGHKITDLFACEVPLVSSDPIISSCDLQGVSVKNTTIKIGKNIVYGDLLFTHFGISGPAAIRSSHYLVDKFPSKQVIEIDLISKYSLNEIREFINLKNYDFLDKIPKRILKYFEFNKSLNIELQFEVIKKLKNLNLTVHQILSKDAAFVTLGGISIKEINPKNMQSKFNEDFYFCGEVLDLSGYTGGFNITIALSTGYLCGMNLFN